MIFGHDEWKVPKNPSEASKRESGHSFDYYPVDIAIFDSVENCGDYRHLCIIIECKQPTINAGLQQLETYLSLEPHVQQGIWVNSADLSSVALYVYKTKDGLQQPIKGTVKELPNVGTVFIPEAPKIHFSDLIVPSNQTLKRTFEVLLDTVVARDSRITRAEEQLNQLCNVILLKLNSDKHGQIESDNELFFRPYGPNSETATQIRNRFHSFQSLYPDIFSKPSDRELQFDDETIGACVDSLYSLNMIDVGPEAVSIAFQVLRKAALKQEEGQYFTPKPVIEAAIRFMDVSLNDIIIDPACGTGGFLIQTLVAMKERYPTKIKEISKWAQLHLFGIDKDAIGIKLTKAVMQILDDGSANCVRGDSVLKHTWPEQYPHLTSNNFSDGRFTKVFTNPPFGAPLKISLSNAKKASLSIVHYAPSNKDIELGLAMFNRCYDLLEMHGKLCIVLPETYFFSPSYKYVRQWIFGRLKPIGVINVPMEAFQGYCRAKTNLYIFEKIESKDDYSEEDEVFFINPKTCGLYKNGEEKYKVDLHGNRTNVVDNELEEVSLAYEKGQPLPIPCCSVSLQKVIEDDIMVPQYYDSTFNEPFDSLISKLGVTATTLDDLISIGTLSIKNGHGSPSNDQRIGDIPYIKVSDVRNMRINVNPTNMIPRELAKKYWKNKESSGIHAWDLVTPNRASSNIGEFAIVLPGEEEIVLTKEMLVITINENNLGIDPFYLLWAFSLKAVREQWRRVTLMQTNREDVGQRFKEVKIPLPPSIEWANTVSFPFRDYFTSIADAKSRFTKSLNSTDFEYIGSIKPRK